MKKFNYRTTVNITDDLMHLGFRCKLPDEMQNKKIRLQAIFAQRQVDRRFPLEVRVEESETVRRYWRTRRSSYRTYSVSRQDTR